MTPPDKIARAKALPDRQPRSYRVAYHRDLRPGPSGYGTTGMDWRCYFHGDGHWCVGCGQWHTFTSEIAAHQAGKRWLEAGRI